ncbi:hypothetical protein [Plantactinospora sp. CA-290183]|uniref:hypothetical protein n=1 Tax=Plantactinospora sp. CA-290183 TaxID=3240006 RepID=UPI003D8BD22D
MTCRLVRWRKLRPGRATLDDTVGSGRRASVPDAMTAAPYRYRARVVVRAGPHWSERRTYPGLTRPGCP